MGSFYIFENRDLYLRDGIHLGTSDFTKFELNELLKEIRKISDKNKYFRHIIGNKYTFDISFILNRRIYYLTIIKNKDDWFYVEFQDMRKAFIYAKCDQMFGLFEFLKNYIKGE